MAGRPKKISEIAGETVIAGDSRHHRKNGEAPKDPWSAESEYLNFSDIDRILKMPDIEDMAGILARSNFKTDNERVAYLRVIRRLRKFGLTSRLEFIRECLASKLGMMAFGKTLQLQSKIELIAPAVIREQLAMRKLKAGEETVRGSDFREETRDKEPRPE